MASMRITQIRPLRGIGVAEVAAASLVIEGTQQDAAGVGKRIVPLQIGDDVGEGRRAEVRHADGLERAFPQFNDNYGPMVRGNRLENNDFGGMVVRGAFLTTETIWDDADIVHILLDEIIVTNHHTFSGLKLKSSADGYRKPSRQ